jgi:uncharacterized protein YdeI (YjbR/CyaY-like superfamily)
MPVELPELIVADVDAWRDWLAEHQADSSGVTLVLARKGTTHPTSVTHDEALLEAIRYGWIDGRLGSRDATTFRQRFTPRRPRSAWSARNLRLAEELRARGGLEPAGLAELERAKADGRAEGAYAGPRDIQVPADLAEALRTEPAAGAMFASLTSRNRFAILYRLDTARRPETRARRLRAFIEMLARGETIHPQGSRSRRSS